MASVPLRPRNSARSPVTVRVVSLTPDNAAGGVFALDQVQVLADATDERFAVDGTGAGARNVEHVADADGVDQRVGRFRHRRQFDFQVAEPGFRAGGCLRGDGIGWVKQGGHGEGEARAVARLPETTGLNNEVIVQKSHRSCYDNQFTSVGARIVEVETAAEVAAAVNARTALMFFMNKDDAAGRIARGEWLDLARRHRVPTLLDAAADVPPVDRLAGYNRMGFDLVAFSGGKAIRGPNDTGLLLGRKSFIDAAARNTNPNCGTIGRALKVSKEDMVALMVAVDRFVGLDHAAERREFERRIGVIETAVNGAATVRCERITPAIANEVPHLIIEWDETRLGATRAQVTRRLMEGDPPIQIGRVSGTGDRGILISVLTLQPGEEQVVGERLRAALRKSR